MDAGAFNGGVEYTNRLLIVLDVTCIANISVYELL